MELNSNQLERYSRHLLLPEIGIAGQTKISNSRVLVVGAGGLGSPTLLYLAAAGVGTLGVIDDDVVNLTNLQRQIIHTMPEIAQAKAISAKTKINNLNPDVKVIDYIDRLTSENAVDYLREYDFVVDCTDNFSTRFLINDFCVKLNKPFSHGSVVRFEGMLMTWIPGAACYRCVFQDVPLPDANPTCKKNNCTDTGVLGAVVGVIGALQATETLKYLSGVGELLTNRLLTFDAKTMTFRTMKLIKDTNCKACGTHQN